MNSPSTRNPCLPSGAHHLPPRNRSAVIILVGTISRPLPTVQIPRDKMASKTASRAKISPGAAPLQQWHCGTRIAPITSPTPPGLAPHLGASLAWLPRRGSRIFHRLNGDRQQQAAAAGAVQHGLLLCAVFVCALALSIDVQSGRHDHYCQWCQRSLKNTDL